MAGATKRSCYRPKAARAGAGRSGGAAEAGAEIAVEIIRLRYACARKIGRLPTSEDAPIVRAAHDNWGDR